MPKRREGFPIPASKVEQYGSLERSETIFWHAEKTRTAPEKWLALMDAHVRDGDISLSALEYFSTNYGNSSWDVIKELLIDYPKATGLFTYMKLSTLQAIRQYPRLTYSRWPREYPLDGLEVLPNDDRLALMDLDLEEARIPFLAAHDGTLLPLENTAVEDSAVRWETSRGLVDTCAAVEGYFREIFKGPSGLWVDGIAITDQGKAVAFLKFRGEKSMLALRTVRDDRGGTQMHKGMLYALDPALRDALWSEARKRAYPGLGAPSISLFTVDLTDLQARAHKDKLPFGKNGMRFLGIRPPGKRKEENLYDDMEVFATNIETGAFASAPF